MARTHRESLARLLPSLGPLRRYFSARADPLTQLFLLLPLFITYHVGVVAQVRRGPDGALQWVGNGVDFLTASALALADQDVVTYLAGAAGISVATPKVAAMQHRASRAPSRPPSRDGDPPHGKVSGG